MCKYNAFRSKIAEAYFNKINNNKDIGVTSRGFIMGAIPDSVEKRICKESGVELKGESKSIKLNELIEADSIIIVANDIPKIMFDYSLEPIREKVVIWGIEDEQEENEKNIRKIISKIKKKVNELNNTLDLK